ncbi:MAG TPA: acyl-CoA dehydrogenase family protein [Bradyrhizobium sp.]|uniref:acyl-CoA dehydrogenase family protein n=1 Tax=Bradyrhizobium sp. TaxID=376 RepID=UPI002C727BF2|nr:acyl-CoA dehydrogenase family protein [Bradyrhizobium sp.]HLZ05276.1 acyl-CoA dehydrogenase family protein [Bradyrhizobium sp.]
MNIQTRPDPLARARELGTEIAASADEIERTRRIPVALLGRLHDSRLFRMLLPRSVGGDETEPAIYVAALEELARYDASIGWNTFVANSSALIAAFLEPGANHAIFADPRSLVAWGPPNASRASAVEGGYRVTGKWDFASGCRQASWMGAHCHVLEADGSLRLNRLGKPTVRTLLFPVSEATLIDTWRTIGLRGTASDSYSVNDLFVSEAFSTTREDPTLRRERGLLYAFTMAGLYAAGVAGVAFGIARAMLSEFIVLASRKAPRGLARLADNAVVQADVARAEARLGSARAYLIETLDTIYARADDVAPIDIDDRARVRLACTNAIQGAAEVADFAYKAAGVDAIFPGSPFERRFRDMHTLSQQIQARGAHFEAVGQIMLGVPPETFL